LQDKPHLFETRIFYAAPVAAQAPASPEWLRNAVLEEAAQACERQERLRNRNDAQAVCRLCARDIRALKAPAVVNQQLTTDQAPAANGDALDAARYRLLRKGAVEDVAVVRGLGAMDYGMSAVVSTYSEEIDGDDLDAAIDTAMRRVRTTAAGSPLREGGE